MRPGAARLTSSPLEFERFEIRVAESFPKPQEFNGAAPAHPIVDNSQRLLRIPVPGEVRQREVVLIVLIQDNFR